MSVKIKKISQGMTLVETIVVLALFTILSLAIMNGVASFYRYNAYTIAQSYQIDNARRGVESLVRDIREMTYADDGAFPLVTKNDYSISFFSDIDRDNSVELVEYRLTNTTLTKNIYDSSGSPLTYSTSTPTQSIIISEYVQNLNQSIDVFTYYNGAGLVASSSASVSDIRYIDVKLIINIDPIRDPGEFMLNSSASLRNLKEYDN
jgi:prepilin-type N-terminal cleavage/methylation domain-containing protein